MKTVKKTISIILFALWKSYIEIKRAALWAKHNAYYVCIGLTMASLLGVYFWSWYKLDGFFRDEPMMPMRRGVPVGADVGCLFPDVDPYSEVALKYNVDMPKVVCDGHDWVECNISECTVTQRILNTMDDIKCYYKDIIYLNDHKYAVAAPVKLIDDEVYILNRSDYFKVSCSGYDKNGYGLLLTRWHGYKVGVRPVTPPPSPPGRNGSLNILIVGFDSTARNGFIRKLPSSYNVLTKELNAVVLEGYNIVGDGTPDALFPILTGKTELQHHPYARQKYSKDTFLDPDLFIFHAAKEDGYQTAYYEDMPWIGSFQYRYNGFSKRPADHYLRSFFMEETKDGAKWLRGIKGRYCIGAKPTFLVLLDLTREFLQVDKKRFCFTFIADISHDDPNRLSTADEDFTDFLRHVKASGYLEDTLLIVMGDHGPRFSPMRVTQQGKLEERMAFMSIVLPERLMRERPDSLASLRANAEVLTTPFDLHTTLLDAMGLGEYASDFVCPNAKLRRGLSLLRPIPRWRTCDEAGVLPHWCVCLNAEWRDVPKGDPLYTRCVDALTQFINAMTEEKRSLCAIRNLTSVMWVTRQASRHSFPNYQASNTTKNIYYQATIIMSPGRAAFEASMQYDITRDVFIISEKDVSRISAYGSEPSCVSSTHPHLNKYCYCTLKHYSAFNLFKLK